MLSPLGVSRMPEKYDFMEAFKKRTNKRRPPKFAITLSRKLFAKRCSPFGVMRRCGGGCASCILKGFVKRRF